MLTVIFCEVDDFCKSLEKLAKQIELSEDIVERGRKRMLTTSDILTMIIYRGKQRPSGRGEVTFLRGE